MMIQILNQVLMNQLYDEKKRNSAEQWGWTIFNKVKLRS
jgi:hypothetical protein